MGFAAGLGEGFQKSFLQKQEQDAIAERDQFQVAYESSVKSIAQRNADKVKHEHMVKTAKKITRDLGGMGVDPAAWTYAYDWLEAGYSLGDVEKKLTTTKFAAIPTAPPPAAVQAAGGAMGTMSPAMMPPSSSNQPPVPMAPTGGMEEEMNGAMGSLGMKPIDMQDGGPDAPNVNIQTQSDFARSMDPTLEPIQQPQSGGAMGGEGMGGTAVQPEPNMIDQLGNTIKTKFSEIGNPQLKAKNAAEAANARVAAAMGMTPEEFAEATGTYSGEPVEHTLDIAQGDPEKASILDIFDLADSGLTNAALSRAMVQAQEFAQSGDSQKVEAAARFNAMLPEMMIAKKAMEAQQDPDPAVVANKMKAIDSIRELAKGSEAMRLKIGDAEGDVQSLSDIAEGMSAITTEYGPMNTWGPQAVEMIEGFKTNFGSVANILDQAVEAGGALPDENDLLSQFEGAMETNVEGWSDLANAQRQFYSDMTRFAYFYAKTQLGQSGSGSSNTDIKNALAIAVNTPDPDQIINNLKGLVVDAAKKVNYQKNAIYNSPEMKMAIAYEKEFLDQDFYAQSATLMDIPDWAETETELGTGKGTDQSPEIDTKPAGKVLERGVVETPEEQARIEAETGLEVPIGSTWKRYSNGYEVE